MTTQSVQQPRGMDGQVPVTPILGAIWPDKFVGDGPSGELDDGSWGHIRWQTGPIQENGRNGVLMEELMEWVILPRMRAYNRLVVLELRYIEGNTLGYFVDEAEARDRYPLESYPDTETLFIPNPFVSRENALAITALEEALLWQKRRTELWRRQGVEGRNLPHRSEP